MEIRCSAVKTAVDLSAVPPTFWRIMMVEAMENLRILAGVLFWSMADLVLSICWIAVFGGLILAIVKGMKHG